MPSAANSRRSRRLILSETPVSAAAPSITMPASKNRNVSSNSGGQSARASLATAKAEDHSRQNATTIRGNGIRTEGDGIARLAVRMGHFLSALRHRLAAFHLEIK